MVFGNLTIINEKQAEGILSTADSVNAFDVFENEFIEKLKSGDGDAYEVLIARFSADVYAMLYRLTGDREEAGDLTQETFLSVFRSIRSFRGDSALKTWLFKIAINHSRNTFRRWKRKFRGKTVSLDDMVGNSDLHYSAIIADESISPEQAVLNNEREQELKTALTKLKAVYREVVILCDIEGLKYEEIAVALDINIGTVKSRLARGRDELRRQLNDF